jgi:hypothetical protein
MDGYFPLMFPDELEQYWGWQRFIVARSPERIVTQWSHHENGKRVWHPTVDIFYIADSPTCDVPVDRVGFPPVPERYEPVEGQKPTDYGIGGLKRLKELMGDQGLVGVFVTTSCALNNEEQIIRYYESPELHEQWAQERVEAAEKRFHQIMSADVRPDFLCVGGSGTLVFQSVEIFRQLAFPAVKRVIELATAARMPTHLHSCGPETELVRILSQETDLTVIDPLEQPPMGDCDLAEIKRLYGSRLTLKGNLHTTTTMLLGTPDDVVAASRKAIDEAAEAGRFILSTGDQCGRDTPYENLEALIETARTHGKY